MIPTTWLSLPCAPVRDAITSCRRVRMVRADWAAVVGGGGAFVIDTPANRCRSRALLPRAAAGYLLHRPVWRSARQIPSQSRAAVVAVSALVVPVVAGSTGPMGLTVGVGVVITSGGAYFASPAAPSALYWS